ncbi:MAG TPA: sugar phosphate isomerase/epimerase family protein [Candidatus Hydrogenedentes bacterium]|nr:sugar phosphate isomerase/epimerase family protein [Candidatus Hydrogenedentota bacterium]HRK34122.1 sugar phosphate isomerase/epimerase family protein [Candidatus Hydrogenedentota bacterium]
MMHCGIFAKTFQRATVEEVIAAVAAHRIRSVQFNMACVGLPSMPDVIAQDTARHIHDICAKHEVAMAAVSGTFNMIHPDQKQRADGFRRLDVLASACSALGTNIITLSTGTRDPVNMWRRHEENDSPAAWSDLCKSMEQAVSIAEERAITIAFEPEVSNVVDSARKARRLLDEIRSPRLRVVIDGANLFPSGTLPRMTAILTEAFDLLGDDIVLAHAKDLSRDGDAGQEAAGTGVLDYDCYLGLLARCGYAGPLILHGLTEDQVPDAVRFLERKIVATRSKN